MLILHHAPQSRSTRIVQLIAEMGIEAEVDLRLTQIPRMDGSGGRDPGNPHPEGKVPLLEHDGAQVSESNAVMLYLTDLYPDTALGRPVGHPSRGAYLSWLAWYGNVFEPVHLLHFAQLSHPALSASLRDVPAATVSDGIALMPIAGGSYDGKPNPHAWMGLEPALVYVDNIRAALETADPANAAAYRANAEAYKTRIRDTIGPLRDAIRALPEDRRWLVTSEGAFSYLARDYGLRELFLWPINADEQGTPQQVRAVVDAVRTHQIPVVFSESTVSDRPARQIARETGAAYGGVLYVDSLSEPGGPVPSYLDLLRVTSETILQGLSQ